MTQKQQKAYYNTVRTVRERFGSYHSIALRMYVHTDEEITGETVRNWFVKQEIPTDYCFVLYEMMDQDIDIFTLVPWLSKYMEVKRPAAS